MDARAAAVRDAIRQSQENNKSPSISPAKDKSPQRSKSPSLSPAKSTVSSLNETSRRDISSTFLSTTLNDSRSSPVRYVPMTPKAGGDASRVNDSTFNDSRSSPVRSVLATPKS